MADEVKPPPADEGTDADAEEKMVSYLSLYRYADWKDKLLMAIGALGAAGNGAAWPVFAIIFAQFTDTFGDPSPGKFKDDVATLATYFVYLGVGSLVCSYLEAAMWMWTGNRQTNRIRQLYLQAVLRQDVPFFDVHSTTGGLLAGLSEDSIAIQQAMSEKVGAFIHHAVTFVVGFGVSFYRGWDMTLVMCGCLPFLVAVGGIMAKLTTTMSAKVQAAYSKANGVAQQSVSQIRTVAAYGQEERAIAEYEQELEVPFQVGIRQGLVNGLSLGSVNMVVFITYGVSLLYGAWRCSHRRFGTLYTGGDVMNVMVAALLGGFSLGQAVPNLAAFNKGRSAAARVLAVVSRKPDIDVEDEGQVLEDVKGEIVLRDVTFAYPVRPDAQVFRNFSLTVPAGKTVALVGQSGSGKSTIVQLIERFYDPLSGQVLLDGVDLRKLQLHWLRTQVGLVSQEPTLFATSILENIAMGRPGASLEEVQEAARLANAHKFVDLLPHKYDTHVGERGLLLSGGQKQRIAIARAILKNPKVLLLDEATSALDTGSERVVQQALDRMVVGRTTVVVAHRLSTIKGADVIAVVRAGAVVEQGTHEELLRQPDGAYTTLVKIQMAAAEQEQSAEQGAPEEEELVGTELVASPTAAANGKGADSHLEVVVVKSKAEEGPAGAKKTLDSPTASSKSEEAAQKVDVSMLRLFKYNAPEWRYAVAGCIGAGIAGAIQPAFALVLANMITVFYKKDKSKMLSQAGFYSGMFMVIAAASLLTGITMQYCFGVLGQNLARRLRLLLLRNVMRQNIAFFDKSENSSAALVNRLSEDTTHIRGAVGDTIALVFQNLMCLVAGYVIAFAYDWRMALVVTGMLPLLISSMVIYYKFTTGFNSAADKLYTEANQTVTDAFSSIRVIHAYNLQNTITSLYHRLMAPADRTMRRSSHLTGLSMGYSNLITFGLYSLVIWFGGEEVTSGRATFGEMLKAFLAVLLAAIGIAQAQVGFPDISKAKLAIQRVFPLLDRETEIVADAPDGFKVAQLQGQIELKDITFRYPTRPEVLVFDGFSLTIPAGTSMALVGESGSGKSTVVGLIERFYDPLSGQVLLDGMDLRKYNLKWVRSQIALVSQEPLLFSTTVLDNIRYGCPDATLEEVQQAAKAANAHDFIMQLPEQYMTRVGERGVQLSGGQKQRVAIARAVVKDPRILLLDEATSALDAAAEKLVQEALDRVMVRRTSVVVAHRLSTIRNADCIAFVHRGQILEQGSHEELMVRSDGGYARLVAQQMAPSKSTPDLRRLAAGEGSSGSTR